jgi:hypothetical protein
VSFASTDPTAPRSHVPVPERNTYYPEWGPKHDNLNLPVLDGGALTGFHVGEILFEKRWAISPDTGEILPQHAFEPMFKKWNSLACTSSGQIIPIAAVNRNFNPEFESCPEVRTWVMTTIDEDGRQVPVGWDHKQEDVAKGPRKLWDSQGENAKTATETLRVYRAQRAMKELQGIEKLKNILPAETYQSQVDAVLAKHSISVEDLTLGLADSPEGFDRLPVSDEDIARVEKMAADEQSPKSSWLPVARSAGARRGRRLMPATAMPARLRPWRRLASRCRPLPHFRWSTAASAGCGRISSATRPRLRAGRGSTFWSS